jgi:flagellin
MGGFSYVGRRSLDEQWQVSKGNNQLMIQYLDASGKESSINIHAKEGDDVEELATYINGQTEELSASVNEDGQLQIFMAGKETSGTLSFSGSLAEELQMDLKGYESVNDLDIRSAGGAQRAVSVLDTALQYVDSHRAELGALQNRFSHAINNLDNVHENLAASNSRIKDADYAKETTQMIKQQILQQVSTSILAQAKKQPNVALSLLG